MSRRLLAAVAAGAVVAAVALGPIAGPSTAGADTAFPAVTVEPTTQVIDGQGVRVNVKTSADITTYQVEVRLCRAGVTYQESTSSRPAADFGDDGPNCPGQSHPISSSSDAYVVSSGVQSNAPTPDGENFLFRVGAGVVNWNDAAENPTVPRTLTCDETHACSLVVELRFTEGSVTKWKPFVFNITYGVSDPLAGCGGPAADVLSTGGSDRMQDAWIAFTLGACAAHPDTHAPTRASFVGEGPAVTQFAQSFLDLAYTAGGYGSDFKLLDTTELHDAAPRAAVAVPVAINASVLGVGGGRRVTTTGTAPCSAGCHKVPYKTIQLLAPEIAGFISGGPTGVTPYRQAILARNSELAQTDLFDTSTPLAVGAYADPESSTWYATRYLKQLAPDAWKVPDSNQFGDERGQVRGIESELANAKPSFEKAITLLSGRPLLQKSLVNGNTTEGGIWVLTDAATAKVLGLTPVQVQDGAQNFVAPTPDSLRAAVASMKANDQGILVSDPANTTAQGGVQPYPMTFVEYALVPAEPLLEDDCSPRTGAQTLLNDWLTYITGDGQAKLPAGMVPLTDGLKADAVAAIAKVGKSAITGSCADVARSDDEPAAPIDEQTTDTSVADTSAPADTSDQVSPVAALDAAMSAPAPNLASVLQSVLTSPVSSSTPIAAAAASSPAPPEQSLVERVAAIPPYVAAHSAGALSTVIALMAAVALIALALRTTARTE